MRTIFRRHMNRIDNTRENVVLESVLLMHNIPKVCSTINSNAMRLVIEWIHIYYKT